MNSKVWLALGMFMFAFATVSADSYVYEDEDFRCEVFADGSDAVCEYVEKAAFGVACHDCDSPEKTIVQGYVYDADTYGKVEGANVTVTCDDGSDVAVKEAVSGQYGWYKVIFLDSECTAGDMVSIEVAKEDLVGSYGPKEVLEKLGECVRIVCVKIPLVPEFGLIIGVLTAFGALGVFAFVRKD